MRNINYVLITGATSGIGLSLAREYASHGRCLILVGRKNTKLNAVAYELKAKYKIKVLTIVKDLLDEDAAAYIYRYILDNKLIVETLINNAGIGYSGEFINQLPQNIKDVLRVNIEQVTVLTRYLSRNMRKRHYGKILNIASTGAYHPGAYVAEYYATKAYILSLSEALYEELKPYNVQVSCLCPGATKTNFQKNSGREDTFIAMNPAFVAKEAYKGMMKGKKIIVPGVQNKLMIMIPKCIGIQLVKRYQAKTLI